MSNSRTTLSFEGRNGETNRKQGPMKFSGYALDPLRSPSLEDRDLLVG
jgi:hypothetical protein